MCILRVFSSLQATPWWKLDNERSTAAKPKEAEVRPTRTDNYALSPRPHQQSSIIHDKPSIQPRSQHEEVTQQHCIVWLVFCAL